MTIWPITANSKNTMNQSELEVKHGTGAKRGKTRVSPERFEKNVGFDWLGVVNPIIKLP